MDTWQPINNGRQQSSYKEFTIVLGANAVYTLNNPYNFCRCLSSTGKFKVAWSTNQMDTDFEGGLQAKFDTILPYVQIFNPSSSAITISLGLGVGDFDDSRLTFSGSVQTIPAQYTTFSAQSYTIASGSATIPPAQKLIIQNTGANVMYIGGTGTDGLKLQPNGTFEVACEQSITIYGTNGDTLAVGSFA